jgi:hypothetical protein
MILSGGDLTTCLPERQQIARRPLPPTGLPMRSVNALLNVSELMLPDRVRMAGAPFIPL